MGIGGPPRPSQRAIYEKDYESIEAAAHQMMTTASHLQGNARGLEQEANAMFKLADKLRKSAGD